MEKHQQEMLLQEYNELGSYLRTFWGLRAAVLAAGLAIIGFVVSLSSDSSFPARQVYDVLLLLAVFVIAKMLGSLSRSMYLYMHRLREIARLLEAPGFWDVWAIYVKRRPMDSGTSIYFKVLHFINLVLGIYVILYHGYMLLFKDITRELTLGCIIVLFMAFTLLVTNFFMIRNELSPARFIETLYKEWTSASKQALEDLPGVVSLPKSP